MNSTSPILLAEDDRLDQKSARRAFRDLNISNPLVIVENGKLVIEYFKNSLQWPCLILLDLNMPQMNGIEFLKFRQADPKLSLIPVVVLTTSADDKDIIDAYRLGVAGYLAKPIDYKQFVETVRVTKLYWSLSLVPDDVEAAG